MEQLGWDSCDIILVTGDAYVDHPSFGMAVIGRVLEAQGFRVGIIAQSDWQSGVSRNKVCSTCVSKLVIRPPAPAALESARYRA